MSNRPKRGANLFEAAGLDQDAPRPLADRLRPTRLAEVVGQDHLLGPDGALTRMLATRSLGSLVFWGPPGTGKTTVASASSRATVVLPVPGGPQNTSEPSERVASMRVSAPSGPSR